jgi:hypothetical protein
VLSLLRFSKLNTMQTTAKRVTMPVIS